MILSCPACGARYLVDATALGPGGRTVRCARCQFQWRQDPPKDMPRRLDPVEPPPPPISGPRVPPPNLPGFPRPPKRNLEWLGWVGLAAAVALVIGGGFVYRTEVVRAWPPASQLYELLGLVEPGAALDFADIRFERDQAQGRNVLLVKGRVLNHSPAEADVPPILVSLVDSTGRQLLGDTVQAKDAKLAPDASTTFESVLSNPPPEAQEVRVTFGSATSAASPAPAAAPPPAAAHTPAADHTPAAAPAPAADHAPAAAHTPAEAHAPAEAPAH